MAIKLKAREVAQLTGWSLRTVQYKAREGQIASESILNERNRTEYLFALDTLPSSAQLRYYQEHGEPFALAKPEPEKKYKPLDHFTAAEREEISEAMRLLERWAEHRSRPGSAAELDAEFVEQLRRENPEKAVSVKTLYRKKKALEENDLEGLVDGRGKARKGKSSINETVWQVFL